MDAVFVQPALLEDKLAPAPKKPRKVSFTDPFIFHAVRSWLKPVEDPFSEQIRLSVEDSEWAGRLAEACVTTHFRRFVPTYYIKAEGEVDIAFVRDGRFWPLEVKWTGQVRPKDLKQIRKYPNGAIWARGRKPGTLGGVPVEPLPVALARLKETTSRERQVGGSAED